MLLKHSPLCLHSWRFRATLVVVTALGLSTGCSDFLNPSFVNLFDSTGSDPNIAFSAVDPPNGHQPIIFRNNARMSDAVFRWVIEGESVVTQEVIDEIARFNPQIPEEAIADVIQTIIDGDPVDLELLALPPRVRLTVDVTLVDGGVQRLEFVEGLRLVRGEEFSSLPPDLEQNTETIFIPQCDIAQIEVASVDVFIPLVIRLLETECFNQGGIITCRTVCTTQIPQFDRLEFDTGFSEEAGTFNLLRNLDPRFFPPPLTNLQCGAVVVIALTGDLTLPFRTVPADCLPMINAPQDGMAPGFFTDEFFDIREGEQVPGRYAVSVSIRTN